MQSAQGEFLAELSGCYWGRIGTLNLKPTGFRSCLFWEKEIGGGPKLEVVLEELSRRAAWRVDAGPREDDSPLSASASTKVCAVCPHVQCMLLRTR